MRHPLNQLDEDYFSKVPYRMNIFVFLLRFNYH